MIDFRQVYKSFGSQAVLADAGFRIGTGERLGIVGPNGAGKSTIFALITGELQPDKGTVTVPDHCRLGYLRQQLRPQSAECTLLDYAKSGRPELASLQSRIRTLEHELQKARAGGRERMLKNLGECQTRFEDLHGYEVEHRAETVLSRLGFHEDGFRAPLSSYSGGWQMRAELARVTVSEPDVLLMDEPSNYLDTVAVEWLQRYLRDFEGTLVLISHDRYLLNSLCTATLEVANTQVTRFPGNYDAYVKERSRREAQRIAAWKKQERKRKQAERFIERFRAKNTKESQVQSKIKQLDRMDDVALLRPVVSPGHIHIPDPPRSGHEVVRLEHAGVTYDASRWVLRDVNLRLTRGSRCALVGLNGTGKTTLLRLLAGELAPSEGRRHLGHNVTVGYQSQNFADTLRTGKTVFETARTVDTRPSDEDVRTLLGGFGFSGEQVQKEVGVLSGGEKVRLAFARMLMNPPSFLILDEPTTHLDITAREALEAALRHYRGTLCFVSHDIVFVRKVASSILAMSPPTVRPFPGGYDDYMASIQSMDAGKTPCRADKQLRPARTRSRQERAEVVQKYSRARRVVKKELDRLEKRITTFEREQNSLAQRLSSGTANLDYADINRRLADLEAQIDRTTAQWERTASELEALEADYARRRADADGSPP